MEYKDMVSRTEEMRAHIEARTSSGMTVTDYCKAHGLASSKYYYWQKRLKAITVGSAFLELSPVATNTGALTIHYPNGVQVTFDSQVNISVVKELVCCI